MRSPMSVRRGVTLLAAVATGAAVFAVPSIAQALAIPITINSIAPSPFSPAGNSPKTETTVDYTVGQDESVSVQVTNGATDVYDANFGTETAGTYQWMWDGTDNLSQPVADGTYTITLTGSLSGAAESQTVDTDSTLPSLSSVHGGGVTFYPVRDGYHDSWTTTVNVSETGVVVLTIKNAQGTVVRTMRGHPFGPSHLVFTWNGRNRAGHLVPAGRYHFNYRETDTAGNHRTTPNFVVHVSAKKLVKTRIAVTRDGASTAVVDHAGCGASVSKPNSHYPHGVLLSVDCTNHVGAAVAGYNLRLPGAIRYTRMSFQVYGYSPRAFAYAVPLVYSTNISDFEESRAPFAITSSSKGWHSMGTVSVAGHYTAGHVVHFAFGIGNQPNRPADFDVRSVRAIVTCIVLR